MTTTLEEGYAMFCRMRIELPTIALHPVAVCVFGTYRYRFGAEGLGDRNKIRAAYPDVYEDLEKVVSLEDFTEIVGRVKLRLFTGG